MAASSTRGSINESPPFTLLRKRSHSRSFSESSDEEDDFQGEIFPSEEEDCDCEIIFPSQESNSCSSVASVDDHELPKHCTTNGHSQSFLPAEKGSNELEKIGSLLIGTCCDKQCLRHLTATDIISTKADYISLTNGSKRLYLYEKLKGGSSEKDPKSGTIVTNYFIAGKEVCSSAWTQIYEHSPRTLSRMIKKLTSKEEPTHGNLGKRRVNTKAESVSSWMSAYFTLIGDKMPDKQQTHLPSWETEKAIYNRYVGDMKQRRLSDDEIAGISAFYKIWSDQFSNVIIPQVCSM